MRFVAIDVETANADMASICSIGAAVFENEVLGPEWYTLIDPLDFFDPINTSIHGISEREVQGAPTFSDAAPEIDRLLGGQFVVTHTHFDRVAIHQAAARSLISLPTCTWIDSARVARRTWPECAKSGYGLASVCRLIGHSFQHHNALEDAKAAGYVMLSAMQKAGFDFDGIHRFLLRPTAVSSSSVASIARIGNPNGHFAGEVIVFTGMLEIPRIEAANLAAAAGCTVAESVTKKTTILVVGDVDVKRLDGHSKTSKHRKAEDLIAAGQPLRIIRETDFKELVSSI